MTQTHSSARDSQRLDELRLYLQGAGYADIPSNIYAPAVGSFSITFTNAVLRSKRFSPRRL